MLTMMIYAVCGTLSAAGLLFAFRVLRRRRYAAGLRATAVALLPMGLAMTGVVRFVVNMTVNPVAWAGFGVVAMSVLLFLVARLAEGRGGGGEAPAAEPAADAPALPAADSGGRGGGKRGESRAGKDKQAPAAKNDGGEDFSDIEEILKKHGI